ncbi:MAG: ABC transporter permease [Candidatus Njordarchaeia archaeon]
MKNRSVSILFLATLGYLALFFYYPLLIILKESFLAKTTVTLEGFHRILSRPTFIAALEFTIIESTLSTILSIVMGLPIAYFLTKYDFKGRNILSAFILVPFVLPGLVVGFSFLMFLGPDGLIPVFLNNTLRLNWGAREWGFIAIIFAHAFYNSPLVAVMTYSVWSRVDPEIEEAAEVLGVHGYKKFLKVTLPLISPGILSSGLLTLIFSFTSFEVVLLLGSFRYRTLEVEIYTLFKTKLDFQGAAIVSIVQLLFIILFTFVYIKNLNKYSEVRRIGQTEIRSREKLFNRPISLSKILLILYTTFFIFFLGFPLTIPIIYSFFDPVKDVFTFAGYTSLFSTTENPYLGSAPIIAPINTLLFSIVNVIIVTILGIISAYAMRERSFGLTTANIAILLPLATSRITIGFGMILAFGSIGFLYSDTRPLIVSSYVIMAYPFTTRSTLNGLSKLDPTLLESAEILGAWGWKRFLKVDLPILAPSIAVGAALAFATGLGEFAATSILYRRNFPTITVLMYLMITGRRFIVASAAATILILMSFMAFLVIMKFGESLESGF